MSFYNITWRASSWYMKSHSYFNGIFYNVFYCHKSYTILPLNMLYAINLLPWLLNVGDRFHINVRRWLWTVSHTRCLRCEIPVSSVWCSGNRHRVWRDRRRSWEAAQVFICGLLCVFHMWTLVLGYAHATSFDCR